MKKIDANKNIAIYTSKSGDVRFEVLVKNESIWLDAHQIAQLFGIDRTGIVRHIHNVYKTNELDKNSTCAKIAQVAKDGKEREMDFYNLDMIISVGYRVNSKQALLHKRSPHSHSSLQNQTQVKRIE